MTARWSGAARKPKAKAERWRAVSMSNVGGFPTALGGQSPKGMFSRVLVARTSVVEASSRHSGTATEERRKAVTRRSVQRTRRVLTWNGVGGHSRARQRCYGQAKAARPAQAPRLQCPAIFVGFLIGSKSRARGRRAGFRVSWALTALTGFRGPGSAVRAR